MALLLATLSGAVSAQSPGAVRSVAFTLENDLIAVRGAGVPPDYEYTQGAKLVVAWAGAPEIVRRVLGRAASCRNANVRGGGCVVTAVAIGQEIYTPRRDAPEPVLGERPYAGWLYASAAAQRIAPGHSRSFGAELGVVGPSSLAEPVQNGVHRVLRNEEQLGWAHQLPNAPGFTLRYGEVRRRERALRESATTALSIRWNAAAGNVVTALSGGLEAMLGLKAAEPWTPAEPEVERPARLYAVAGYRQDVVLRSIVVDGRAASGQAERRPFVGQAEMGFGYRRRKLAFAYRHVLRGREYVAQPAAHAYGSITITVHGF